MARPSLWTIMRTVSISSIAVSPNRQRRSFDPADIMELANSITQQSLLQAIVVREGGEEGKWVLVAGERRLRAIQEMWDLNETLRHDNQEIPLGFVPIVTLGELNVIQAEEAELEENVRRKDLTWQEHAAAVRRLADLRAAQAEAAGKPAPSTFEIAKETYQPRRDGVGDGELEARDYGVEETRQELIVSRYLDDPDVAKSKTLGEAFKVLKAKEASRKNAEVAERIGKIAPSELHTLVQADCLEWLEAYKGEKFDVLLTDPPYGMGADSFGDSGGAVMLGVHSYNDDPSIITNLVVPALARAAMHCKESAHAYVFCDIEQFFTLRQVFNDRGWKAFRTPLIWVKNNGRVPLPQHGPRRQYETILYAFRGDRPVLSIQSDVIECPTDDNLGLGAQKPIELFSNLLRRSARPGDRILDPFAGTGTTLVAAHLLRCLATCIESAPAAFGIAAGRLGELK